MTIPLISCSWASSKAVLDGLLGVCEMRIESIKLKNYKSFRDATLKDIPPFLVVVGANGAGKTTLFDVFGFVHDCLKSNVRHALDSRGRFKELLSRESDGDSILIEIQYRMEIAGVLVASKICF